MRRFCFFSVLLLIICSQAQASEPAKDPVLAVIGEKKILMSDFDRLLKYYSSDRQKLFQNEPTYKINLLKRLVEGTVLSEIARKEGFDRDPAIKEQLEIRANDFIALEYGRQKIMNISVEEKDIREYYELHKEEFATPEMIRARHILIRVPKGSSDADRAKARARIEEVLKKIRSGGDFAKIAAEVSEDEGTKPKGGDLGFVKKGVLVPEFEQAAYALQPGEVSGIVETPFGLHILKTEEKKESGLQSYDEAKAAIKEKLSKDVMKARYEDFMDAAYKKIGVETHPELLGPKK